MYVVRSSNLWSDLTYTRYLRLPLFLCAININSKTSIHTVTTRRSAMYVGSAALLAGIFLRYGTPISITTAVGARQLGLQAQWNFAFRTWLYTLLC